MQDTSLFKGALLVVGGLSLVAYILERRRRAVGGTTMFRSLRGLALSTEPSKIGVTPAGGEIWGVVMDLPISTATASIVAFADGAVSIYLSEGGGFIGGGGAEPVRRSGEAFLAAAKAASASFTPATEYPLPKAGKVRFYARVGPGVAMAEASEQDLQSGSHPLSALYGAGHGVIRAYRESRQ